MTTNKKPNIISAASLIAPPLDVYSILQDEKIVHVYGAKLIRLLSQIFRVPYKVSTPTDGGFGVKLSNGSWSGMIGMVMRSEVDLAVGSVLQEGNYDAVNFSYPYLFTQTTFMTDKLKPESQSMAIIRPFSLNLWILLAAIILFFSLILSLQTKRKQPYHSVLFMLFGHFLEKSVQIKLRKKVYRVILSIWLMFTFVITNSYKALLLSFLTLPPFTGIRKVSDLGKAAEGNSITCYTYKGISLQQILIKSDFDSWKSISKCLQQNKINSEDAVEAFLKAPPGKAFIGGRMYLEPYRKEYFISEESFFNIMFGSPVSRNFCCKNYLNKVIHRLFASGVFQKLKRDQEMQLELKLRSSQVNASDNHTILQIQDLKGAFIILICGYILTFLSLLIEITLNRLLRRNIASFKGPQDC